MQAMDNSRNSKQRTAILEILEGTTSHPTAEWVYQEAIRSIPNISLGTVYRNLSKLAEAGIIQRMEIGDGIVHYDYTTDPHDHFYCNECGRLYDVPLAYDKNLDKVANETRFGKIDWHQLIYHGVCKACLK